MSPTEPDILQLLQVLDKHKVEFVIVGGVAAVLLGAPVTTFDLDIVHARTAKNLDRLSEALVEIDAHYREHLDKHLAPAKNALDSPGHHLLMTNHGPLDVMGAVAGDQDYDQLIPKVQKIPLGDSAHVNVLSLPELIALKERTGRPKDQVMLTVLRALAAELAQEQHD